MQDDTQRPEQTPAPSQPSSQPTPPPVATPNETTVTPRGLEHLRSESSGGVASGFGSLGLGAEEDQHPFHAGLDTSLPYGYDHPEPMYLPLALSVGAGFKFGCGFMLALGVTVFALFLVLSVLFFVAALVGLPLPGGPGSPL